MAERLAFLELIDEVEPFVTMCNDQALNTSDIKIISLDPKVESLLNTNKIGSVDTSLFFNSDSHAGALNKSAQLLDEISSKFHIEDGLGLSKTYSLAFLWYSRYFINHLLYVIDLIYAATSDYPKASLIAPVLPLEHTDNPIIQINERYLGHVAKQFCEINGLAFQPIELINSKRADHRQFSGLESLTKVLLRLGAVLHRAKLRRLSSYEPAWVLSHGSGMDRLVKDAAEENPHIKWVVRGEASRDKGIGLIARVWDAIYSGTISKNRSVYIGEVWDQVLCRAQDPDDKFIKKINEVIKVITQDVTERDELFSYRGITFSKYYADKLNTGIREGLIKLHLESKAMEEVLSLLRPKLVIAPFGRRFAHSLGQLARDKGIPGILISHGSFTPLKNDLERKAWSLHADGLFHGSYSHAVLQTPLSETFSKQITADSIFVKTGPLSWGLGADRRNRLSRKRVLLGKYKNCKVVVHAGTPKMRQGIHFHVFETTNEYVSAIRDLAVAINKLADVVLIIRFRPLNNGITINELKSLLPWSDKCFISTEESFSEILGLSDLLVSFSSTTIEEALQASVPVLQYGGAGRYQHVAGLDVSIGKKIEKSAVYTVNNADHLPYALNSILNLNFEKASSEYLFAEYKYTDDEIIKFPLLTRNLINSDITGEIA